MTRLSRRDRAALTLTLHALRGDILERVVGGGVYTDLLAHGDTEMYQAVVAARLQLMEVDWRTATRWLRARLALAIRAILRADAGDFGPTCWTPKVPRPDADRDACARSHGWDAAGGIRVCQFRVCCKWEPRREVRRPYVALWEQARRPR